jgi:polysaccharide export outer membrane protein
MGLAPLAAQMSVNFGRPTLDTCARVAGFRSVSAALRMADLTLVLRAFGGAMLATAMLVAAIGCAPKMPASAKAALEPMDPAAPPEEQIARIGELWTQRTDGGVPSDFCLGTGDLLEINVFHWEEMRGIRTRVSSTGMINLPLIGDIKATGLTEKELRESIEARLRQNIMRNPQVSVFVAEYASQQVSVTGAVSRPGLIPLTRENRTISHMISEAGGLSDQAGGRILFYPANTSGRCDDGPGARKPRQPQVASARPGRDILPIEIDVNEQYEPANQNPLLLPAVGGDNLVINRGRFLVDGWVAEPGAFDITPGMTAFGGLSAAGGAEFAADLSKVVVWRTERGGRKKRIDVNLNDVAGGGQKDVTLQAGDVVKVPVSPLRLVPYSMFWLVTNVFRIGAGLSLGA